MNYRHAFHAGSFADVVKHTVLLQLIYYLQKKPAPYCFIDTHAGEGVYDLSTILAQKTGEAQAGIIKLLQAHGDHPASILSYLALIENQAEYPGSPMCAFKTLRPQDKMILNEKHPQTYQHLKQYFKSDAIAIHQRDAYEFLPAVLPPPTSRGLVLIDPAFEDEHEMEHLRSALFKCVKRWPQGMYLIWLPIVGRSYYTADDLRHSGFKEYLQIEFCVDLAENSPGLIGCSLLLINPPWQIEETLGPMLAHLWQVLHVDARSQWRMRLIRPLS